MAAKSEERRWRWLSCRYSRFDGTHHLPAGTVRGIPSLLKKDFPELHELGLFSESVLKSNFSEAGLSLENEDARFTSWLARFNSGTAYAMEMGPRMYLLPLTSVSWSMLTGCAEGLTKERQCYLWVPKFMEYEELAFHRWELYEGPDMRMHIRVQASWQVPTYFSDCHINFFYPSRHKRHFIDWKHSLRAQPAVLHRRMKRKQILFVTQEEGRKLPHNRIGIDLRSLDCGAWYIAYIEADSRLKDQPHHREWSSIESVPSATQWNLCTSYEAWQSYLTVQASMHDGSTHYNSDIGYQQPAEPTEVVSVFTSDVGTAKSELCSNLGEWGGRDLEMKSVLHDRPRSAPAPSLSASPTLSLYLKSMLSDTFEA